MAGNAQSKLGELFVDIGVNGLGKTLKGLNSISASFLLTKNAATQLVKPIVNMTHQFGQSAIGLEKMKLTFGTTIEQAQRMQAAFKKFGMQEIAGEIQRISDLLAAKNYQGLGENFMAAMSKMNIDIRDYNGSLESTLDLFDKISDGLEEITQIEGAAQARFWAQQVNTDYANLMMARKQNIRFSNLPDIANKLTQEEVDMLIKRETSLLDLQFRVYQAMEKIFVTHGDKIFNLINKTGNIIDKAPNAVNKVTDVSNIKKYGQQTVNKAILHSPFAGLIIGASAISGTMSNISQLSNKTNTNQLTTNGQYEYRPDLDRLGESNLLGNRTINVTQNITTSDTTQAARKSVEGIREAENRATAHQLGSLRD